MAVTHTWAVNYLDTAPLEGSLQKVVKSCRWSITSSEEVQTEEGSKTYTSSNYGYAQFESPDPQAFVSYESLTEAQVLDWVWAAGVDKASVEAGMEQNIDAQKNPPTVVLANPWAA